MSLADTQETIQEKFEITQAYNTSENVHTSLYLSVSSSTLTFLCKK